MASVYLRVISIVSREVPDEETLAELEEVAERLRDKYPLSVTGWSCIDGKVSVLEVSHDWPDTN